MVKEVSGRFPVAGSAAKSGLAALCFLQLSVIASTAASEFPTPENYHANAAKKYVEDAAAFLKASPESVYAPRVAFDALIHTKRHGGAAGFEADLEGALLLDYPDSLHGGYYLRTLAEPKVGRQTLEVLISRDLKQPRDDFPQKFAGLLGRFLKQCGGELIEDHGIALKSILILEQTKAAEMRQELLEGFWERLKPEDSEYAFAKQATDAELRTVDRIVALHTHALEKNLTAASLRDLLLRRLPKADSGASRMRFIRAEALIQGNLIERAIQEYREAEGDELGDKELWLRSWCEARSGKFTEARRGLDELRSRFPKSEYVSLASEVIENLLAGKKRVDDYAKALGRIIDCAAKCTDSFHVMINQRGGEKKKTMVVFVDYSGPRNEFSTTMCDPDLKVVAGFRSTPKEIVAFADGWGCVRRFDEAGFVPVPVLSLILDDDGNSFSFRTKSFSFGVPIPSPLLDIPWFADAENQGKTVRYFQKMGMCFAPIKESSKGRILKCIWPSVAGPRPAEWLIEVSGEGRLLKVESEDCTWEFRSGMSLNQPFDAPAWPDVPVRQGDESYTAFLEVFMRVMKGVL
jgi:hypothetical protein